MHGGFSATVKLYQLGMFLYQYSHISTFMFIVFIIMKYNHLGSTMQYFTLYNEILNIDLQNIRFVKIAISSK